MRENSEQQYRHQKLRIGTKYQNTKKKTVTLLLGAVITIKMGLGRSDDKRVSALNTSIAAPGHKMAITEIPLKQSKVHPTNVIHNTTIQIGTKYSQSKNR